MKKHSKKKLIDNLDTALNKTVSMLSEKEIKSLVKSSEATVYGNYAVYKKNNFWCISYKKDSIIREDILSYDAACCIAICMEKNKVSILRDMLSLESEYAKHYYDLVYYNNIKKSASLEQFCSLEDRIDISVRRLQLIKRKLTIFKVNNR